jgi:beta-lactamase regulating signal transducer with metallopeptidase domain
MDPVNIDSKQLLVALLSIEAKGALLLFAAMLSTVLLRWGPAAARHRVLLLAVLGLVALPAVEPLAPRWSLPAARWVDVFASSDDAAIGEWARAVPATDVPVFPVSSETAPTPAIARPVLPPASAVIPLDRTEGTAAGRFSLGAVLLGFWGVGAVVLLTSLLASLASLRRLTRRSAAFPTGRVTALAEQMRAALGIRQAVTLLQGETGVMPMSWGLRTSRILLPAEAERWHRSRLVSVLLHEMAHVRRRDCLTQVLAEVILAAHWPNPLVWLVTRRLRVEREHACDDVVVAAGARPSEYAEELLSLARGFQARGSSLVAMAMARPTHLATRLRAVLEERRARALPRGGATAIALTAATMVVALAGFGPAAPPVEGPYEHAAPPAPAMAAPEVVIASAPSAGYALPAEAPSAPESAAASNPPIFAAEVPARSSVPVAAPAREPIPQGWMALVSRFAPRPSRQQATCGMATEGWRQTNMNSNDDSHRLTWSRPGCQVDVRIEGDVEFSTDLRDIARLGTGAYLRIEEEDGGTDRRLDITAGAGGAPVHQYRVNGDVQPFDASARAWYEGLLQQVFRRTGLMARERVAALLSSGGVAAVNLELETLSSDHVFSLYVRELLSQADLSDAEAVGVVERAAPRVESDHYMAAILEALVQTHLGSDAVLASFIGASRTLESDHYRAQVLGIALQRNDLPAAQVAEVLASATEISSDHYLAELLGSISSRYALEPELRASYLQATESIESDHYRAAVLSSLLERSDIGPAELAIVLRSSEGLESDHYATEVLQQVAQRGLSSEELMSAYLAVSDAVESDHYRGQALKSLLARETLTDAQLQSVIRSAAGIGSDHYKADVLLDIVRRFNVQGETRTVFLEAMGSLSSSHYRGSVADALLRRGPGA